MRLSGRIPPVDASLHNRRLETLRPALTGLSCSLPVAVGSFRIWADIYFTTDSLRPVHPARSGRNKSHLSVSGLCAAKNGAVTVARAASALIADMRRTAPNSRKNVSYRICDMAVFIAPAHNYVNRHGNTYLDQCCDHPSAFRNVILLKSGCFLPRTRLMNGYSWRAAAIILWPDYDGFWEKLRGLTNLTFSSARLALSQISEYCHP